MNFTTPSLEEKEKIDLLSYIKVSWVDTLDNHTVAREKEIETYFKKKYETDKVKVVFSAVVNKQSGLSVEGNVNASEIVLDENYQKILVDKYLKDSGTVVNMDYLNKLDGTVNTYLEDYKDSTSRYKKYKFLKIEFSNFLSFGENNKLDFTNKPGVTSIISNPQNYGGKTIATIDLIMFLLFGTTTKTKKNIDIFNRFTDKNRVWVRGEIEIENDIFVLERTLSKVQQKDGEYKVTASMEFQKKLIRGGFKSLKGDEKKITEELIKTYVGTESDFLMTILSTADTLDDLIKTLPTERGQILTRFIGLEFFREKAKIAKKLYDEWKTTTKLHNNNMVDILTQIDKFKIVITEAVSMKEMSDFKLGTIKNNLLNKKDSQDILTNKRIPVDTELYMVNEDEIKLAIVNLNKRTEERQNLYNLAVLDTVTPIEDYDVDALAVLEGQLREDQDTKVKSDMEKMLLTNKNIELKNAENCSSCLQPLVGVDFTSEIAVNFSKIKNLVTKLSSLSDKITLSLTQIKKIKETKILWDEFSKKELTAGKIKIELEQFTASLKRGNDKLTSYMANKENVENNKKIDTEISVLKNEIERLDVEKDTNLLKSRGFEKDIENATLRIVEYDKLIANINKEEVFDKIYRTYLDVYGKNGISKMVLGTMIPLINIHLKAFLSDTCDFTLEMRMNDKNEVDFWMVDYLTNIDKPIASGSGFEKTVSSLALRCVLTKVCSLPKPNIILFDEVFGKVSNDNLEKLGLFFDKIKEHFEQIWLISHNPFISEWADHTIMIRKNNNVSELIND